MDSQDLPNLTEHHATEQSTTVGNHPLNPVAHITGGFMDDIDWDSINWNTPSPNLLREFDQRYGALTGDDDHDDPETSKSSAPQTTAHATQSSPASPNVPESSAHTTDRTGSAPPPVYKSTILSHGQQGSSSFVPVSTAAISPAVLASNVAPLAHQQVARVAHSDPLGSGNPSSTITRNHSPERARYLPNVSSPLNDNVREQQGAIPNEYYSRSSRPANHNQVMHSTSSENPYSFAYDNTASAFRGTAGLTELPNEENFTGEITPVTTAQGSQHQQVSQQSGTNFVYMPADDLPIGGNAHQDHQYASSSSYEPAPFGYTSFGLQSDAPTVSRYEQPWGGPTSRARTALPLNGAGTQFSMPNFVPSYGLGYDRPLSLGHTALLNAQWQPRQEQYSHTSHWQSFPNRQFQQPRRALWPPQTVGGSSSTGHHISPTPAVPDNGIGRRGLLTSPEDLMAQARIELRWQSLAEAEEHFHRVVNSRDASIDPTFPRNDAQQRELTRRIMYAMCHMHLAEDNEGMRRMWERAQRDHDVIEDTAWKILRRCMDASLQRDPLVPRSKPSQTYNTFGTQLDHVCQALMTEKTICKHLCGAPYLDTFIDDPTAAANRVKNNRKVNGGKKRTIAQGKEALRLVGQHRSETSMEPGLENDLLGSSEQKLARQSTTHHGTPSEIPSLFDSVDTTPELEVDEEDSGQEEDEYLQPTPRKAAAKQSSRAETTVRSTRKRKTNTGDADATYAPKTPSKRTRKTKKESKYPIVRDSKGRHVIKPSIPTPPGSSPPAPTSILGSSPYAPGSGSHPSPSVTASRRRTSTQYRPSSYQQNVYNLPTSYDSGYMPNATSYLNPNMVSSSGMERQSSAQVSNGFVNGMSNLAYQYGSTFSNIRDQYDGHQDIGGFQSFPGTVHSQGHIDPSLATMSFLPSDQINQDFGSPFGVGSTAAANQLNNVDLEDEFEEDEIYGGRLPGEGRSKRRQGGPAQQ